MIGPFYRACRKHGEELENRTEHPGYGPEVLWCKSGHGGGHRCRSWDVRDNSGEVLAVGFINEPPEIVSAELTGLEFQIPVPEKRCKKGHYEWSLEADGNYRCAHCKRDRNLRALAKKAKSLKVAQQAPVPKAAKYHRKGRVLGAAVALKYQAEQLKIERALQKVNNRIKKEQRCRILPTS